ncbi:MAG: hypothetical protein U0353_31335 [Sandaracinus sp.]
MRRAITSSVVLCLAASLAGCPGPRRSADAGPSPFDAPFAPLDAPFLTDAHVAPTPDAAMGADARMAMDAPASPDAFVPTDAFAGTDASSARDAFVASDAFSTTDAYRPPVDAGPVVCTALPATGSTATTGDTTITGLTWERPLATTCPASDFSTVGTAVPYQFFTFCNEGVDGTFDFVVDSAFDSYLVVYDGGMIPADPLMCLDGDDDSGPTGSNAQVSALPVAMGGVVTVVVSGFDNADSGAFTLTATRN